jgi:hypothetical protein
MTYTISRDRNTIHVVAGDVVTLEDCVRAAGALVAEGMVSPGAKLLIDVSDLTPQLSFGDLRALVREVERMVRGGLHGIAIVSASDWVYGLARTFSTYAELQGLSMVAAFRSRQEAETWLEKQGAPVFPPVRERGPVKWNWNWQGQ